MKEKLLVLDDEELILTSLEHLFEDDYEVFTTTDAETALRLATEHDIAVILCDERMPGVSGHEFQKRVKEVSRATRMMMSGYADMNALTEAVNNGQIFAYMAKPWEPLHLREKIASATVHFKLVQEVDQERGLLRALMENIPDPIYFKDCVSRFTRVNQAHARAIGAKNSDECIGRSDADYFDAEVALRWRAEEEVIIRSGQPYVDRIEHLKHPQGGFRWMSRTKVPMFDRSGQVSGLAGISRDITALKNSEEMLREQNEDLLRAKASAESANRAKSEFLATMSHEMRTPMNAILGMADLLSASSLEEEQRSYVQIFQEAGASLLALITDILDLSKVESGQFQLESIRFNVAADLEKIIEMMISRAHERGLQLTLEVMPGVPLELVGDPQRLRQILINLVGNALKFTEQGSVTVRVEPDPGEAAGWLRFSVVDTGIGIPADKTEMIFERFTQADSSTTREYGGTGLGLAISKGIVELMGGRIGCTSEAGRGSTFFITAPFAIANGAEAAEVAPSATSVIARESPSPAQPVYRILIVEDCHFNVVVIEAYLKGCGFQLDFAKNGKIAVEKVISGNPDLVLMDIQMPVMDGLEATRAIRQWEKKNDQRRRPILAITANAGEAAVAKSLEAGCTEHFTKPIKRTILLEALSHYLSGRIRVTPPSDIESLVASYLVNVRRDMDAILAALDSKDCEIARRLGHQFKGSGENYGFPEIARAGAAVELAAMDGNEGEVRSQMLALSNYLDIVEVVA